MHGLIDFSTTYDNTTNTAVLEYVAVVDPDTGERVTYASMAAFFAAAGALPYEYFYVYDGNLFFGFVDNYCARMGWPTYDELKDDSGRRKRLSQECWSYTDGAGVAYIRKLWVRSRAGTTRKAKDRHMRLRSFIIYNFRPLCGSYTFAQALAAFGVPNTGDNGANFGLLVARYNDLYKEVTGEYLLRNKRPAAWTIGGAARASYLTARYTRGKLSPLKQYQAAHPFSEKAEMALRAGKLLLPGLLVCAPQVTRAVYSGALQKYDCNHLYPFIMATAPELGRLECSTYDEYENDTSREYVYIIVFKRLECAPLKGMPRVFENPFDPKDRNAFVSINREYYMFANLWERLQRFYEIYDFEVARVLKCKKQRDPVLTDWVLCHYSERLEARKSGNAPLETLYKLFTNNLGGKFLQKSFFEEFTLKYNEVTGEVEKKLAGTRDNWDESHFDYVRGAFIYVSARCYMLDIISTIDTGGRPLSECVLYMDTDSILTPCRLPNKYIDPERLGAFKLEKELTHFCALAPKTYAEVYPDGSKRIVAAGMGKDYLRAQFAATLGVSDLNTADTDKFFEEFLRRGKFETFALRRVRNGNAYVACQRYLGDHGLTDGEYFMQL